MLCCSLTGKEARLVYDALHGTCHPDLYRLSEKLWKAMRDDDKQAVDPQRFSAEKAETKVE